MLAQDLHSDRALSSDHLGVVVGWHEGQAALDFQLAGMRQCFVESITEQDGVTAEAAHGIDLDGRCGARHHDDGRDAEALAGERDALGMIAGGRGDDAARTYRGVEAGNFVIGAAQLEREDRL